MMPTSTRLPAAVLLAAIATITLPCAALAQASTTTLQGRWLPGDTGICALASEPWPGPTSMLGGASFTITGCADIDSPSRPLMRLLITVTNTDSTAIRFRLPLLGEVTARVGTRQVSAYALYLPPRSGFATAITVGLETEMGPGQSIQLLYLLPRLQGRRIVTVGSHGRLRIQP